MARHDLLALNADKVAVLSNRGLVKRAAKELSAGKGPELREEVDGTVVGTFADGTEARLPPGVALADAPCTCAAPPHKACRHRVAVVLAYLRQVGPADGEAPSDEPDEPKESDEPHEPKEPKGPAATSDSFPPSPGARWSPGTLDDTALERFLGRAVIAGARRRRKRGVTVEIRRAEGPDLAGSETGDVPTARLPTCTVRFLVPGELAMARCDCRAIHGCEHLALAVWAFRAADRIDPEADQRIVDPKILDLEEVAVSSRSAAGSGGLAARAAIEELLLCGLAESSHDLAQRFAVARRTLSSERDAWPMVVLGEIEGQIDAWNRRSALFNDPRLTALAVELYARYRAAERGGALPASHILGRGEPARTELKHVALTGLGARVLVDGEGRVARFLLADFKTGDVLVLTRRWKSSQAVGFDIGRRGFADGTLHTLAGGRTVSQVASRMVNRAVLIGRRKGGTSVMPQTGASWADLPAPLKVERVVDLARHTASRPPAFLRPHLLGEDVHVLRIAEIVDAFYDPARQAVIAEALDAAGELFRIGLEHRAVTPHALDALGHALTRDPSWVAGPVRRYGSTFEVEPTALVVPGEVIVPDLAGPTNEAPLDIRPTADPKNRLDQALGQALSTLQEAPHRGLQLLPETWSQRARQAADELQELGLNGCAQRLRACADAVVTGSSRGEWRLACEAWTDATLRLLLAQELR